MKILIYYPKATTAVIRLVITQRRVHFAMWEVGLQLPWFQQEHSVRTAGPHSTQDIWPQRRALTERSEHAAATFAGTRHRRSQLVEHNKTKQWSTMFKSSVDHYHVRCIQPGKSWPVSFALSDGCILLHFTSLFYSNFLGCTARVTIYKLAEWILFMLFPLFADN